MTGFESVQSVDQNVKRGLRHLRKAMRMGGSVHLLIFYSDELFTNVVVPICVEVIDHE